MPARQDLVALLVAHKVATAREVERIDRGRGDAPLWRAVLDAELLTADKLFELFVDKVKVPVVSDKALATPPSLETLTGLLTKEEALHRGILPFELSADGRRAQVAMVDPTDETSLRELAKVGSLQAAKVFVVEQGALAAAIERAYVAPRKEPRASVEPAAKGGQRSAQEEQERLERVLVQASLTLGTALELELERNESSRGTTAGEAARLAREVARELAYDRRRVALAGLAAMIVQLDAMRRSRHGQDDKTLFDLLHGEVGWAGAGDDGLLGIARALSAQAAGFGRQPPGGALQRVVQVVVDFLALRGPGSGPLDLDAAEQLIRTSSGGGPVLDALMRILRRDLAERTPAVGTALPEAQEGLTTVRVAPREPVRGRMEPEDRTQQVSLASASPDTPSEG